MIEKEKIHASEDFQVSYVFKGLLWSITLTIVLAIISALLLQYTALSENLLSGFATFIFFVSMFIGATMAAYSAQGKGLLYGLAVSMSYFLLTIIGGLILDSSIFTLAFVVKRLGLTACAGVLGGIIGVGLVSK
ncbi:MAG TPA: TIGR04086 family membrane protein [Peptococcaceae bacterium]|nr:TIGR04086 family membrane protein [Clostridia bacterium]HOB81285.1 TIGR04086 family membrane protein [Peptococcaceae bacterium]HQD53371.1 TIGR04086 family membrane protein [Peptococcaceae bacterium]